jgi:spermidine synthase
VVLVALPADSSGLAWFVGYWSQYDFFPLGFEADRATIVHLYVVLPLVLFFVPTLLMGLSFPILQRAVQDDPATSGRKVGVLQAANIAGCVAGSLLVGLVGLDRLGTPGSLRALVGLGIVFALVGWRRCSRHFAALVLLLAALVWAVPGPERLWRRLHGVPRDVPVAFFEEDATSVVALAPDPDGWRLSVNGKGNSYVPYGRGHTLLGAVPASVHPAPRDVAIVGLGSGDTAWASAWRPETRSLTVFEISAPQPRILRRLAGFFDVRDVRYLLEDPRLHVRIVDGRKTLEAEPTRYDLVEADATWPQTMGSGNLYSLEFFQAVARRLKPGGVMCTWSPTERVGATFRNAFPHVLQSPGGDTLIGSNEPIPFTPAEWAARAARAADYLGPERAAELVEAVAALQPGGPAASIALNRDLWPRDEYAVK